MWNRKHRNNGARLRLTARRHALDIASRMREQDYHGRPLDSGTPAVVEFAQTIAPWLEKSADGIDLQIRVAALEQVVANVCGHVSRFDRDCLLRNARTFYEFLAGESAGTRQSAAVAAR